MTNELKFHTNTNLPNYGCKLYPMEKLPKLVRKFIKKKGVKPIIVKRRKQGLTGSGILHECHENVELLVRQYGGTQLSGYWILPYEEKTLGEVVEFDYHSVWVTPEGVAVDVTSHDSERSIFIPLQRNPRFNKKSNYFIDLIITKSKKRILYGYEGGFDLFPSTDSISIHKSRDWDFGIFSEWDTESPPKGLGGFTNPSLLTGRTWTEIQQST